MERFLLTTGTMRIPSLVCTLNEAIAVCLRGSLWKMALLFPWLHGAPIGKTNDDLEYRKLEEES